MLNRQEIRDLIENQGLMKDYIELGTQLTPNGFDLTCAEIYEFKEGGALDFSNKERKIPNGRQILPQKINPLDKFGWWDLQPGAYKIKTNETCNIPKDLIALGFPRSSLLRMGAFVQNAVWDAGFQGRSEFILVVANPHGVRVKQNARLVQLMFMRVNETEQGYNGVFKNLK
jgi:dUTP pyrophosphatase